jgi:hypothetical protein
LGETVTVTGRYDDNDFDAITITRPDGSPVLTRPVSDDGSHQDDDGSGFDDSNRVPVSEIIGTVGTIFDNDESRQDDDDYGNYRDDSYGDSSHEEDSLFNTAIYRFQNRQIGGTYLFAGDTESASLRSNHGAMFQEEGFAFRVADQPGENLEAIYRMANKAVSGTYLYVGEAEKQSIAENHTNFENEGIAFYVLGASVNQGQDVYRFQSLNNPGTYLFALEAEKDSILANHSSQFALEGVAFEVG